MTAENAEDAEGTAPRRFLAGVAADSRGLARRVAAGNQLICPSVPVTRMVPAVTDRCYIWRKTKETPVLPELPPRLLPNHTRRRAGSATPHQNRMPNTMKPFGFPSSFGSHDTR